MNEFDYERIMKALTDRCRSAILVVCCGVDEVSLLRRRRKRVCGKFVDLLLCHKDL